MTLGGTVEQISGKQSDLTGLGLGLNCRLLKALRVNILWLTGIQELNKHYTDSWNSQIRVWTTWFITETDRRKERGEEDYQSDADEVHCAVFSCRVRTCCAIWGPNVGGKILKLSSHISENILTNFKEIYTQKCQMLNILANFWKYLQNGLKHSHKLLKIYWLTNVWKQPYKLIYSWYISFVIFTKKSSSQTSKKYPQKSENIPRKISSQMPEKIFTSQWEPLTHIQVYVFAILLGQIYPQKVVNMTKPHYWDIWAPVIGESCF